MRAAVPVLALIAMASWVAAQEQPGPFVSDAHTLLLYHFDEGSGDVARDAGAHGQDGVVQGAEWAKGKFAGGLWFDGTHDSVFLARPDMLRGLKQITVEAWFNQEATGGRRFLMGDDVCFHFEVDDAAMMSISLYNQGGGVPNAEGKPHQQVYLPCNLIRPGRWHHLAITYNGQVVSYFLDGVLKGRLPGPKDFSLGVAARGLWVGCYVNTDYWYSGLMDEVRVSDCVRYDPEGKLQPGGTIFAMSSSTHPLRPAPEVRKPAKTGVAALKLALRKLHGGDASGWVCMKTPGKPAAIVGRYAVAGKPGQTADVQLDVSDEYAGDESYIVGLVPEQNGYFAVTSAELTAGGKKAASWSGDARSRVTFQPPILLPLKALAPPPAAKAARMVFLPAGVDWATGALELDMGEEEQPPLMGGDGGAEWWFSLPADQAYRVYMRYAAAGTRPCDLVLDGDDLNAYDMCALNTTGRGTARDSFWEYQGTARLSAGVHWLRAQDVLPDIVALRFEPVAKSPAAKVPWARFPVPGAKALATCGPWQSRTEFGKASGTAARIAEGDANALSLRATFANTDQSDLFAGDCVRFTCPVKWDLEPFGRLRFTFRGAGTGHAVALWAVDVKGDEKLLWRQRDTSAKPLDVEALLNFEGNDVFDPGRVVAICLDLDEGNVKADQPGEMKVSLVNPVLDRRDTPAVAQDLHTQALAAVADALKRLGGRLAALASPAFRPWTKPVVPEEHPLYASTEPKPVTRKTLGYDLHGTGARDIATGQLKAFHEDYNFGDICWPHVGILPQRRDFKSDADYQQALKALEAQLQEVRKRGLILWDIWGYVPYGEAGPTPRVTPEHHEILLRALGDRFLGYDNGEQDGRYIGSYADRGQFTDRRGGWEDFVRWDEGICNDSMNYMNATGSLNFSHYYGERGCRTLGLETAQGLPSDTLMFGFLRGAAKQYGRLTTQAASIWSRFGYNMYGGRHTDGGNGYGFGPHKGCSLSLHGMLFFQSYTGGDSIVGSETSQFTSDTLESGAPELSPLGRQHLDIIEWVRKHPDRGIMYTPVAFMLDFYNGWNPPRHLYRGDKYKIWGKLRYEKGDYLIDNMFRMVWPGYEDCSYLRNERGFLTPTPYGDIFDVITNRCHPDILKQYTTIMLLGDVEMTPQVAGNLDAFVRGGGDILLSAGNARQLATSLTGLYLGEQAEASATGRVGTDQTWAEQPYTYTTATLDAASPILINETGQPILTVNKVGKGRVIVCLADQWMTGPLTYADPKLVNMEPPFRLLDGVRAALDEYFASFSPVAVEPGGLNLRVNCYDGDAKRLLVALTNTDLFADWQGMVRLRRGEVASVRDLRRDAKLPPGRNLKVTVPAGDVVILDVRLK
jgi:hypothetical protein